MFSFLIDNNLADNQCLKIQQLIHYYLFNEKGIEGVINTEIN
jgi:hypothetical protein